MPSMYMSHNGGVCAFLKFWGSSNQPFSELKGGSKRVNWKSVAQHTEWYISEAFLLPGKPFENPTRLGEATLCAYWNHWFRLSGSSSGEFTFKEIRPPGGEAGNNGDSDDGREPKTKDIKQVGSKPDEGGSGKESEDKVGESQRNQALTDITPDQCHSDEEKIEFLRSLCPWSSDYQAIVGIVAEMMVSSCRYFTCIRLITQDITSPLESLLFTDTLLIAFHGIGIATTQKRPFMPVGGQASCSNGLIVAHT